MQIKKQGGKSMPRLTSRSNVGEGLPVKHLNLMHMDTTSEDTLTEIIDKLADYEDCNTLRPIKEWGEDYGDCLFHKLPIEEPPYCGSPLDCEWEEKGYGNYYTHFTKLTMPIVTL